MQYYKVYFWYTIPYRRDFNLSVISSHYKISLYACMHSILQWCVSKHNLILQFGLTNVKLILQHLYFNLLLYLLDVHS